MAPKRHFNLTDAGQRLPVLTVRVNVTAHLRDIDIAGRLLLVVQRQIAAEQPNLLPKTIRLAAAVVITGLAGGGRAVRDLVVDYLSVDLALLESFLDRLRRRHAGISALR